MSLALSTLLYEWRRYLGAVIALAVAGLLVLTLTGLGMGLGKSVTTTVDRSPAAVLVVPPDAEDLFSGRTLPRRIIPEIYQHSEVLEVKALNISFGNWSNFPAEGQPAKTDGVQIIIIDPVQGAVTLPNDFHENLINALQEPFTVVVDRSSLGKLGVRLNDKAKLWDHTVWVRATTEGYPSLFSSIVFVSHQTAKLLNLSDEGPRVGALVVKIRDANRARQVANDLNQMGKGQYKAWSREDFSEVSQRSMLKDSFFMVVLGFAVVVGTFIGIVITWQTLQGAIMANIKEFASLRALGISMRSLRLIIMELSLWVGLAGLILASALSAGVWLLAQTFGVPMSFPLFIDIPIATAMLIIAILSGVFSLGVLKKSQPADLLR